MAGQALKHLDSVHGVELVERDGDRFLGSQLQLLLPLLLLDAVVQSLLHLEVDLGLANGLLQLQSELVLGELKNGRRYFVRKFQAVVFVLLVSH